MTAKEERKKGLKIGPVENGIAAQVANGSVLLVEFFLKKAIFLCYFEAVKLRNIDSRIFLSYTLSHASGSQVTRGKYRSTEFNSTWLCTCARKKTLVIFILRC